MLLFFTRHRRVFTAVPWVLAVVMIVVNLGVIDDVARDAQGDSVYGYVLMFSAVVPVTWAILETMWLKFDQPRPGVALARTLFLPLLMGPLVGLSAGLARLRPGVEDLIASSRDADGWHYWFDASRGGGNLAAELPLIILTNVFTPMLVALGLVVFVVLPWFAFMRPAEFVEANMMDTSPASADSNARAAQAISILLMVIFAGPTLVIWLDSQRQPVLGWVLGVASAVVGVALIWKVLTRQVVDHEARRNLPRWARGVQTHAELNRRRADPDRD